MKIKIYNLKAVLRTAGGSEIRIAYQTRDPKKNWAQLSRNVLMDGGYSSQLAEKGATVITENDGWFGF